MPLILFPRDRLNPNKVDSAFEREWNAATVAGWCRPPCRVGLVDENAPVLGGHVQDGSGETAIYRGWMLTTYQYTRLYRMLWRRGYHLINEPDEYRYCHELPSWYNDLVESTPRSVWFSSATYKADIDSGCIARTVQKELGPGPYIVKDYVKSRKHEWNEACFIESADDIERVVKCFAERQST